MTMKRCYVVCAVKPWNVAAFARRTPELPGTWHLIESVDDLTLATLERLSPRYVFFPHWSWRVPSDITTRYECVCFHMTDVPYGRGGSPLQNLISRGHTSTMLTALRMVEELDAGPVYLKRPLSLEGRAEDIFGRAADVIYDEMAEIVSHEPALAAQQGEIVVFPRRAPGDSLLPPGGSPALLYDFIRMLDAPTYPKAFLEWGEWLLEFDRAHTVSDSVEARVVIHKREKS
jgi:methionyl-tRNA formyltransferase